MAIGKLRADIKSPTIDEKTKRELRNKLEIAIKLGNKKVTEMNQLMLAQDLLKAANMDPLVETHTFEDLKTLASFLPEYQIKLWVCEANETLPHLERHFNEDAPSFIGLVYYDNHFECVATLKREVKELR